jgi:putative transposase
MVNYRRALLPGATYFFTVTLRDRRKDWLIAYVDQLRSVVRDVRRQRPFAIDAIVVRPSARGVDAAGGRCRLSRALTRDGVPPVRDRRGEYDLWQRRYWEHLIRDDDDLARHVDYIHYNPVKHGLVADPFGWRCSS